MKKFIAKMCFDSGMEEMATWDDTGPLGQKWYIFDKTNGFPPYVQIHHPLSPMSKEIVTFIVEKDSINVVGDFHYANYKQTRLP